MPLTVSLIEDDLVTRESLRAILARDSRFACLGAYASAEEALTEIPTWPPDVVLVDINLPGRNGIECAAALKTACPDLALLMLTTYDDSERIFASLRAGASGYLLKRTTPTELLEAIEEVHRGGSPMSTHIARRVVSHFHQIRQPKTEVEKLTAREHEILALLAKGFLYKEIADQLGISASTVRAHLHAIYGKLHVQSRTEAVVKFLGAG